MTRPGPVAGTLHVLRPAPRPAVADIAESRPAPKPPIGLKAPGRAAWRAVMSSAPLLLPSLDSVTVKRFAELVDERELVRAELDRGFLLEEPIVSPVGKVVGTRMVANPAVAMLRGLDKQLDSLADRLGLVPAARARLGLTLTTVERQAAEVRALADAAFLKDEEAKK
jgi:P27 family predicted phage terminase small subunit